MTSTISLPRFSSDATCPKCGYEDIQTTFIGSFDAGWVCREHVEYGYEHHHRLCERCSYGWPEAPLTDEDLAALIADRKTNGGDSEDRDEPSEDSTSDSMDDGF